MSFILGDVLDHHESIDIEYKEFCFKTNLFDYYSKQELRNMIKQSVLLRNFDELIIDNIQKYIHYYVPRYVSAFHNSKHSGEYKLFIGINDFNEITGIPFKGNLRMYNTFFTKYMEDVIRSNVSNKCCVSTQLETFKTVIDEDILNDDYLGEIMEQYDEQDKLYSIAYEKYVKDKKKWIKDMYFYKGKLQDVVNNNKIKLEFVKYLEKKNLLKMFPEVFWKYHTIPSDSIKHYKKSPIELLYWLIQFKDERVNHLMTLKPVEPMMPKILNIEYCLLTKMTSLRKRLVTNANMSYYTILVTFKCTKECPNVVSFRDPRTRSERTLKRYICPLNHSPKCRDMCSPRK
uniref:Uncharacterized protein n=1 Tax=Pyramimonas orientalis virus TaxID=455367 RepID=A0A7M3UP61_POV01|nr:hypothetical protein HWQ62_00391 [Pyramimonas orientalis virus]